MKKLKLSNGKSVLLDDNFYSSLSKFRWYCWSPKNRKNIFYAATNCKRLNGKWIPVLMHHCILGKPVNRKLVIDHVNRNGLDNRRENLRIVSNRINLLNREFPNKKSKYIGVSFDEKRKNKWRAAIFRDGKNKTLGRFATEEEAARAYILAIPK